MGTGIDAKESVGVEAIFLSTFVLISQNRMYIQESNDPELNELAQDVKPEKVLDTMEKHKENSMGNGGKEA